MSSVPRATRIGPGKDGHAMAERSPGSVRNARERIEERQRLEDRVFVPSPTSPTYPPLPSPHPVSVPIEPPLPIIIEPLRNRPPMPAPFTSKVNLGAIGAAISGPSPMAQWPLREEGDEVDESRRPLRNEKLRQRPQRPGIITSPSSDQSRPQDQYPPFPYRPPKNNSNTSPSKSSGFWEDDYHGSPNSNRKTANSAFLQSASSRTSSSLGSIPDFPVPTVPTIPTIRRTSSKDGPPNSRRGVPSSYYSIGSNVLPIPEEAYDPRYQSFASSKAMPSSWGSDHVMGHYFAEDPASGESDNEPSGEPVSPDQDDQQSLVQQANVSKRQRPSITSIDSGKQKPGPEAEETPVVRMGVVPKGIVSNTAAPAAGNAGTSVAPALGASKNTSYKTTANNTSGGSTSTASPSMLRTPPTGDGLSPITETTPASGARPKANQANAILAGIKQAGSPEVQAGGMSSRFSAPRGLYSDNREPFRRPARLNLDNQNARDVQESRGSLTSLPELIRRATRLATTLDKGGRPASRWDPMLYTVDEKPRNGHGQSDSFSGMIDSFPPPGLTPTTDKAPSTFPGRQSYWPGPFGEIKSLEPLSDASSNGSGGKRRRYCCGISLVLFVLLVITGTLIIAAAVVIPVTLIVIPRQRHNPTPAVTSHSDCGSKMPCLNGGASILTDTCHCICVNGFSGLTCNVAADSSCASTKIDTKYPNATVGSSIPRLFELATSNFSIPLNSSALFSDFSQANSSCSYENALVTFNGNSNGTNERRAVPIDEDLAILLARAPDPASAATATTTVMNVDAITSNGIVFANPTATSAMATATSSSATPLSFPVDNVAFDFARVSVLYIIQEKSIDFAVEAQEKMQSFFDVSKTSSTVDVGNGISVDFNALSLNINNSTVGGTPGRGPS